MSSKRKERANRVKYEYDYRFRYPKLKHTSTLKAYIIENMKLLGLKFDNWCPVSIAVTLSRDTVFDCSTKSKETYKYYAKKGKKIEVTINGYDKNIPFKDQVKLISSDKSNAVLEYPKNGIHISNVDGDYYLGVLSMRAIMVPLSNRLIRNYTNDGKRENKMTKSTNKEEVKLLKSNCDEQVFHDLGTWLHDYLEKNFSDDYINDEIVLNFDNDEEIIIIVGKDTDFSIMDDQVQELLDEYDANILTSSESNDCLFIEYEV